MPNGIVHAKATAISAPIVGAATLLLTQDPLYAALASAGCLCGIPLSPDLDLNGISHFEWVFVKYTFGLWFLWLAIWRPYAVAFKHHSLWSHGYGISTAIRLAYIAVPYLLLVHFTGVSIPAEWLPYLIVGLLTSDVIHQTMDKLLDKK